MDCEPVTNRHERTRVVIPIISPAVIARSAAEARGTTAQPSGMTRATADGPATSAANHSACSAWTFYFNDSITAPKRRPGDHKRRIAMLPSYDRKLTVPVLVLLLSLATAGPTLAQKATPAAYPVAPDPSECVIDPAPIEEIAAILGTPVAEPAVSPSPFVPPASQPADPETSAKVVATLRQIFACANAGDPLRFSSLFTDDFVRNFFADVPLEDLLDFLAIPPQPLPENQERIIIRFGEVQLLPDGRAGVVVVLDEPDDPRIEEPDYAILEQVEDRWLVDELHEDRGVTATSPTGTPAA